MKILVTGVDTALGGVVCRSLLAAGHEVVGSVRNAETTKCTLSCEIIEWKIGHGSIDELLESGATAIVHCEFDNDRSKAEITSDAIVTLACNAKVKKIPQVFIAPAFKNTGIYEFDGKDQVAKALSKLMPILRIGVVASEDGEIGELKNYLDNAKILTYPASKTKKLPITTQLSLRSSIELLLKDNSAGNHWCIDHFTSFHQLISHLLREKGISLIRIPLPAVFNQKMMWFIAWLNGRPPKLFRMTLHPTTLLERMSLARH